MREFLIVVVVLAIIFGLDFYVFQGYKLVVKAWFPSYKQILYWLYWMVPFVLIGGMIALRVMGRQLNDSFTFRLIFSLAFMLYVVKLCWLVFIILDDIIRLGRFLKHASDIPNEAMMEKINRSQFLISSGALVAGSLFGGFIYGILRGAHNYQVQHRRLDIKGLPKEFDGMRILQLSDIHTGSFWNKPAVERGIELITEQEADVILFTGDLVNDRAEEVEAYKELFSKIKAPEGVYSVLGNHDYGDYVQWPDKNGLSKDGNLERLKQHQADLGWNLLINDSAFIERNGKKLALIGVENWSAHANFPKYGRLQEAYQKADGADVKMLLSHDPSHWKAEVLESFKDIVATFSGHTHGMQFGVDSKYYRWSPVKYRYPEWVDLYKEGEQYLYVNRGFGYLGYPGRVGFHPEITVFELRTQNS